MLSNVTAAMVVSREETFGPLAPIFSFKDEQDAVDMANATEFGLAAYFYSRDIGRIWRVAEALEYGIVGINEGIISNEVAPFGGIKESGIGREGFQVRHGRLSGDQIPLYGWYRLSKVDGGGVSTADYHTNPLTRLRLVSAAMKRGECRHTTRLGNDS